MINLLKDEIKIKTSFNDELKFRCPFAKICPKLRKLNNGKWKGMNLIYGYCDYQRSFQVECFHYKRFISNPSYRGRR